MPSLKKILFTLTLIILLIYVAMHLLVHFVTPTQHVVERDFEPAQNAKLH